MLKYAVFEMNHIYFIALFALILLVDGKSNRKYAYQAASHAPILPRSQVMISPQTNQQIPVVGGISINPQMNEYNSEWSRMSTEDTAQIYPIDTQQPPGIPSCNSGDQHPSHVSSSVANSHPDAERIASSFG